MLIAGKGNEKRRGKADLRYVGLMRRGESDPRSKKGARETGADLKLEKWRSKQIFKA